MVVVDGPDHTMFRGLQTTLQTEELGPEGKEPRAKSGHKKTILMMMNHTLSKMEATSKALQATSGPTSLGVTGEERAGPQLSSVESTSQSKPVYSVFTIVYFQSASGHDASSAFTDEADLGNLLRILLSKHKDITNLLEMVSNDDEEIKWDDLKNLVKQTGAEAIDLNSPKDDQPLQISSDDEADIQKYKLEKDKVVVEADLVKAQPSYPNVQQLIELLVNSLKPELVKILIDHDFILDAIPSRVGKVIDAMERFANAHYSSSQKAGDKGDLRKASEAHLLLQGEKKHNIINFHQIFQRARKGSEEELIVDSDVNVDHSDLHLGEWKEVMDACLKRTGAGRSTIYTHMRKKLDALPKTEQELELDLSIPLEETKIN
ncbi:hypothetical protein Tco_1276460 [Tanacetum coccineum]